MVSESISSAPLTRVKIVVLAETAFSCFGVLLDGMVIVVSYWQCWKDTVSISKGHLPLSQYLEQP